MPSRSFQDMGRTVGFVLRDARREIKQSMSAIASTLGITHQQLQKYETGATRIPLTTFIATAQALQIEPELLLARCMADMAPNAAEPREDARLLAQTSELASILRRLPTPEARERLLEIMRALEGLLACRREKEPDAA